MQQEELPQKQYQNLPFLELLWEQSIVTEQHPKQLLKINKPVTNQASIRICGALNNIPDHKLENISDIKDPEGNEYISNIRKFKKFMIKRYGEPVKACMEFVQGFKRIYQLKESNNQEEIQNIQNQLRSQGIGYCGIILFQCEGCQNYSAHYDLFDGESVKYKSYFDRAQEVYFWECPKLSKNQAENPEQNNVEVEENTKEQAENQQNLGQNNQYYMQNEDEHENEKDESKTQEKENEYQRIQKGVQELKIIDSGCGSDIANQKEGVKFCGNVEFEQENEQCMLDM